LNERDRFVPLRGDGLGDKRMLLKLLPKLLLRPPLRGLRNFTRAKKGFRFLKWTLYIILRYSLWPKLSGKISTIMRK
jgi:hypothetical protein